MKYVSILKDFINSNEAVEVVKCKDSKQAKSVYVSLFYTAAMRNIIVKKDRDTVILMKPEKIKAIEIGGDGNGNERMDKTD